MTSEIVFIYLHSVVWNPFVLVCVGEHGPGHGFFVILILRFTAPLSKPLLPKIVLPQEAIFDFGNIKVVKQFTNFHIPGYNMRTFTHKSWKCCRLQKNTQDAFITRSTFRSNAMKENSYQHKQQNYNHRNTKKTAGIKHRKRVSWNASCFSFSPLSWKPKTAFFEQAIRFCLQGENVVTRCWRINSLGWYQDVSRIGRVKMYGM